MLEMSKPKQEFNEWLNLLKLLEKGAITKDITMCMFSFSSSDPEEKKDLS